MNEDYSHYKVMLDKNKSAEQEGLLCLGREVSIPRCRSDMVLHKICSRTSSSHTGGFFRKCNEVCLCSTTFVYLRQLLLQTKIPIFGVV